MKKNLVLFVHGKGGNIEEADCYKALFPQYDIVGLDYMGNTPWSVGEEIDTYIEGIKEQYSEIFVIAISIGAYYVMSSKSKKYFKKALFISPIVDFVFLINSMMKFSNVTEEELEKKKIIPTTLGEDLSWEFLSYVKNHPIDWNVLTEVIYGEKDNLMPYSVVNEFCLKHSFPLYVFKNSEHYIHTDEDMKRVFKIVQDLF